MLASSALPNRSRVRSHSTPRATLRRRCAAAAAVASVMFAAACSDALLSPPRVVSAELTAPAPLVRTLQLTLARPTPVVVEYWADDGPRLRVRSGPATTQTLVLARLRPGRSYHYVVDGTGVEGTFTSDTLPSTLASLDFTVTGATDGLVMMHLYDATGYHGYAAVDGGGNVVWYWPTEDFPFGMARRPNGDFVFMDKKRGLVEVTPDQRVLHELAQDSAREMHHDVIVTPGDTVLFIAFDDRQYNGALLRGDAIWAWLPETGASQKLWTAWDHFDPATDRGRLTGAEWIHANALAVGPRGNVLLSMHHWNQIVSIAAGWQAIEWRLGGPNATIPVRTADQFSGQHSVREIAPGHVILFDNGIDRLGPSRGIELALDGDSAHAVFEWAASPPNYASALGTARRLPNGHTVIGYGMGAGIAGSSGPVEVYELDADGAVVWHLVPVGAKLNYRAEPLTSIAGEEVVP